ncbi:MAG: hypothetical protein GY835_16520 [bacterium]|nr:hypothetical protein [bacterium]
MKIVAIWRRLPRLWRIAIVTMLAFVGVPMLTAGVFLAFIMYDSVIKPESYEVSRTENSRYLILASYDPEAYTAVPWVDVYFVDKDAFLHLKRKIVRAYRASYAEAEFLDSSTVRILLYGWGYHPPPAGSRGYEFPGAVIVDLQDPGMTVIGAP